MAENTEWGRLDLNLLIPLNALLLERNVTKAAERLVMAQPTMSATLARLRRHFDDPLLVREGRSLVLTPLAESLRAPVQTALIAAREALAAGRSFDPATDQRTFTVMASDYASTVLLRPALRGLAAEAPGVRVTIEPLSADGLSLLRSRRSDLLIWPLQLADPELLNFPHAALFGDEFIAVADKDNAAVGDVLTAEALNSTPAVGVAGPSRPVSTIRLNEQMVEQPVVLTVDSFTLALQMVAGSELITLTQRRLFEHFGPLLGLREVPMTIEPPKLNLGMFWHPRDVLSPAHQWLRGRLERQAALR
ncbi:DNA-binding transcriptional regulator, LysR family [Amycolatopsis xylanica]|uniref:DNA-binding transcriptional regulator, LysR family n=1 Tax=Amycolatopsis xylanica TaxID=589385 RepID=A0A1H2W683_9PSEU|nr:LysR family transcriptional regulator [Amycolatopsis xylanica]SDW76068.1 DNA-binding transcriptional regulator, LysR family [Amycolatopsis xylanica]